jgi:perosamine synthetase
MRNRYIIKLDKYVSLGDAEKMAVAEVMDSGILSGFTAGPPDSRDIPNGGPKIRELEAAWCERYGVKHALTFNSATSGLYAACAAVGIEQGDHVITTPWTMSATVAAPLALGAVVDFADIEDETYCIDPVQVRTVWEKDQVDHLGFPHKSTKAVIAVNLFGHPAQLAELREICNERGMYLIEDAAQTPLAKENGKISGTVGDLGVYSLNRHKHIHCGEGGIVVTNDDLLAARVRSVRNHGIHPLGLNLRMTELEAAIALVQLQNIDAHVKNRRGLGWILSNGLEENNMYVPFAREGCEHDYYMWVARFDASKLEVPHIKGYIQPLHDIFLGGQRDCPVVEAMRKEVVCFESCKYDPTDDQLDLLLEKFDEAVR